MRDLTLDSRRESRLRLKECVHFCAYSWVEVLIAALLSPNRAAHLYKMTTEEEEKTLPLSTPSKLR